MHYVRFTLGVIAVIAVSRIVENMLNLPPSVNKYLP